MPPTVPAPAVAAGAVFELQHHEVVDAALAQARAAARPATPPPAISVWTRRVMVGGLLNAIATWFLRCSRRARFQRGAGQMAALQQLMPVKPPSISRVRLDRQPARASEPVARNCRRFIASRSGPARLADQALCGAGGLTRNVPVHAAKPSCRHQCVTRPHSVS
jgi:hypothetical protein